MNSPESVLYDCKRKENLLFGYYHGLLMQKSRGWLFMHPARKPDKDKTEVH